MYEFCDSRPLRVDLLCFFRFHLGFKGCRRSGSSIRITERRHSGFAPGAAKSFRSRQALQTPFGAR
jgi:hypothetical protein